MDADLASLAMIIIDHGHIVFGHRDDSVGAIDETEPATVALVWNQDRPEGPPAAGLTQH